MLFNSYAFVLGFLPLTVLAQRQNPTMTSKLQRLMERCLWFWPRIVDAAAWAKGAAGRLQTPLNHLDLDFASELLLKDVMRHAPDPGSAILDVGCNVGGISTPWLVIGISPALDAMGAALELFRREFPETAQCANISHDLFQRFLRGRAPGLSI